MEANLLVSLLGVVWEEALVKLHLEVLKWAIVYKPAHLPGLSDCSARLAFPFEKRDKIPLIYYKPQAGPEYFKKITPEAYKAWERDGFGAFPCEKVPVVKITPWGKTRKLYINLIRQTILGIQYMRDYKCAGIPPDQRDPIAYTEFMKTLDLHRQYNAV